MKKYSKSFSNMWRFKNSLKDENDRIVMRDNLTRGKYRQQPLRCECKLCGGKTKDWGFCAHGVEYFFCRNCGHLNGIFQDTDEFCASVYEDEKSDYGEDYNDKNKCDYESRVSTIYSPKVGFLKDCFANNKIKHCNLSILDIGAGTGHFIRALEKEGINGIGIEVDKKQVDRAKKYIKINQMEYIPSDGIIERIRNGKENTISFIYVLEHVVNLKEILEAVELNKNIKYIFFSVPMFSYSVIFGALEDEIADRMLGGGEHSHLFTNKSIQWLCKHYKWDIIGEWRFGADIADLYRIIECKLEKKNNFDLEKHFKNKILAVMDELQGVIDRQEFCSDIHLLIKKDNS